MDKMILQIQIYTRKFFRTLKKESIISIFIGIIITILVMSVTEERMFDKFEGTKSGLFSLVCVCIWIGIFNSIQLVCREKNDIVKDELDKSLRASSYMAAHFIYQFFLCLIQSLIVFIIFVIFMADKGDIGSPIAYLLTMFLMIYASDAMAFVISSAVPTPIVAMTVMPLLLLIQLVMAGVLFPLGDVANGVANFTVSKWGMMAFGKIGDICSLKTSAEDTFVTMNEELQEIAAEKSGGMPLAPSPDPGEIDPDKWFSDTDLDMYSGDYGEIFLCWLCFAAFIVAFYFISVGALKFTTRKMKK